MDAIDSEHHERESTRLIQRYTHGEANAAVGDSDVLCILGEPGFFCDLWAELASKRRSRRQLMIL